MTSINLAIEAAIYGIFATAVPLPYLLDLRTIPAGTIIRPMALAILLFFCAGMGLFMSLPPALQAIANIQLLPASRKIRTLGIVLASIGLASAVSAVAADFVLFSWLIDKYGLRLD